MNSVQIVLNTGKKTGTAIRKLNGGNLAPNIAGERSGRNIREPFRQLNLAYARLHDAPLDNPGGQAGTAPETVSGRGSSQGQY